MLHTGGERLTDWSRSPEGRPAPPPTSSTCSRRSPGALVTRHAGPRVGRAPADGRRGGAGRAGARRRRGAGVRVRRGRAAAGAHHRRDRRRPARPRRRVRAGRAVRLADPWPGQRAADRPQLLLRRPQGDPVAQRLGGRARAGRLADRPAPRRHRRVPAQSVGLTVWGTSAMRTQGDDIAEVLALLGTRPVWDEASRRVTGFEIVPRGRAGPPAHRRHGAHLRLLPRRVPARHRAARRRDRGGRRAGRAATTTCATHVEADLAAARRPAAGHRPDLRLQARRVRGRAAAADRRAELAQRRRPRRGVRGVGRLRLRPRPGRAGGARGHGARVPAHRGGREEPGHPRARHRRLRRLLPVPRRHGRDGPRADRPHARAPTSATRAVTDAVRTRTLGEETKRVFRARVVNPRWIAAMQRHGYKGAFELAATVDYLFGYDATAGVVDDWMYEQLAPRVRLRRDQPGVHGALEPVGAARHHRAAAGGGRPGHVGQARRRRCSTGCGRPTSSSRATWRGVG